jgi:ParB family chromosome partitioning protein
MDHIRIDDMQLGPRLREDLGDLEELARSIARHGLLHPPVFGRDKRLIVGMRRVRACQLLGWTEIEVRWIDELPEDERLAIELEENLRRKDLTAYERSKGVMQRADAVANRLNREAQADEENPSTSDENPLRGRPPKPDADAKVAAEIGVSQSALSLAKQHVAVIEKYPELRAMTQRGALDTANEWDGLSEDARAQRRDTLRVPAAECQADDHEQVPSTTTATARLPRPAGADRFWDQAIRHLAMFHERTDQTEVVRQRASRWSATARDAYLEALRQIQKRVTHLIGEIEQVVPEHAPEDSTGEPPAAEEPAVAVTDERATLRRLPAHTTQLPEGVRSAQEPERPERQDGSMDTTEPTAPRSAEAPEPAGDFEARGDACIERINTLLASGVSWSEAARQLEAEGMPTPTGVKAWNHGTLIRLAQKMGIERGHEGARNT